MRTKQTVLITVPKIEICEAMVSDLERSNCIDMVLGATREDHAMAFCNLVQFDWVVADQHVFGDKMQSFIKKVCEEATEQNRIIHVCIVTDDDIVLENMGNAQIFLIGRQEKTIRVLINLIKNSYAPTLKEVACVTADYAISGYRA